MKNIMTVFALFASIMMTFIASCKKEQADPAIPNEEELITSLYLNLIDTLTQDTITFSFVDLDGDGGNPPVITNDILNSNSFYQAEIVLLNESVDPPENITEEVEEEGEDHQLFYQVSSVVNLSISYDDEDLNGDPVGLHTTFQCGIASSGELKITLRHEPNKSGDGVADGEIENAGGETDIEVIFDVEIL